MSSSTGATSPRAAGRPVCSSTRALPLRWFPREACSRPALPGMMPGPLLSWSLPRAWHPRILSPIRIWTHVPPSRAAPATMAESSPLPMPGPPTTLHATRRRGRGDLAVTVIRSPSRLLVGREQAPVRLLCPCPHLSRDPFRELARYIPRSLDCRSGGRNPPPPKRGTRLSGAWIRLPCQ